ncbi:MAG: HIT domain-containing protein [Ruminococcus sp.]|nr:HIT domain-containing protein [Ruminococcus sp.]
MPDFRWKLKYQSSYEAPTSTGGGEFTDVAEDVDGHVLVIPKKHAKNILDCDSTELSHLMETVKKVSLHLVEKCGYNGVNLLNASDESAGQSVPHFHIHIIPRKKRG